MSALDLMTVPNCIFVPQLPSLPPTFAAHNWLHLQVGLLNVAYGPSTGAGGKQKHQHHNGFTPPMHQPLTLPLSLHLHPAMLTPKAANSAAASADSEDAALLGSWIPLSLVALHRSLLPTLLVHLPSMISQIKVKKMDKLRHNRVGIVRAPKEGITFSWTFRETTPAYHVLTVSAKRIKQMDRAADAKIAARNSAAGATSSDAAASAAGAVSVSSGASAASALPSTSSLSAQLSNFPLFSSPSTPITLLPVDRVGSDSTATDAAGESAVDEGFYAGRGYASYLVSKHTLHVRMIPTARILGVIAAERTREIERRRRLDDVARQFDEEDVDAAQEEAAEGDQNAGDKRKRKDTAAASAAVATVNKKSRAAPSAAAPSAAAPAAAAPHSVSAALSSAVGATSAAADSADDDAEASPNPPISIDDEAWLNEEM